MNRSEKLFFLIIGLLAIFTLLFPVYMEHFGPCSMQGPMPVSEYLDRCK